MSKAILPVACLVLVGILFLGSGQSVAAVTTTTSSLQTEIFTTTEYVVSASVSANVADGTVYYLRGEFFKPGTTKYCGLTWNGAQWYNGPYTAPLHTNLQPITITSNVWNGQLKALFDPESANCNLAGQYNFRVLRYTTGGSSSDDGQTPLLVNVVFETPTPTPTPTPTLIPTLIPTSTPTLAPTAVPTLKPTSTPIPRPTWHFRLRCRVEKKEESRRFFKMHTPVVKCHWEREHGGEGESRTREELSPLEVFKTSALDHYATSP